MGVFLKQKIEVTQNCCFRVKEQVLSFPEHQKSLKSVHYWWRYINFSIFLANFTCSRVKSVYVGAYEEGNVILLVYAKFTREHVKLTEKILKLTYLHQ